VSIQMYMNIGGRSNELGLYSKSQQTITFLTVSVQSPPKA